MPHIKKHQVTHKLKHNIPTNMEKNFFEDLQSRKTLLKQYAIKAKEFGWIDEQRMNEIITKLDNDTLIIGVIGQMKCGKSTFLNSFVFEDDILPAATTPMTAALSVIKYGDTKKVVAEFYNQEEWTDQQMQAKRNLSEITNELEISKVKAAKELVEKSQLLGGDVTAYLGKTKEDTFDNLIEYVGADGKYVSITKSVTIFYPKEYLKGVEIVDTPGFNDPIVSREERTKDFLKKADVVLLMLYAGRPFDATDRTILFQNVRSCGIGKVIVGVNKYDIPYESGETPEQIQQYVKDEIQKACADCNDSRLVDILRDATPILLSANMALLSEISMNKINSTEEYKKAWERGCDIFEISNQSQFREHSHIDELTQAVKNMVEKEKGQILFAKPINSIIAAGQSLFNEIEKNLHDCESKIKVFSIPDDELEEKEENLLKAVRRMEKKINNFSDDLTEIFDDLTRKAKNELEDNVDAACKRLNQIVDDWGTFKDVKTIQPQMENVLVTLQERTIPRCVEQQTDLVQRKLRSALSDFFSEVDEVMMRYLPDYDQKDIIDHAKKSITLGIESGNLSMSLGEKEKESNAMKWIYGGVTIAFGAIGDGILTAFRMGWRALKHDEVASELKSKIRDISSQFDALALLSGITSQKNIIVKAVKKAFMDDLLIPIQKDFEEVRKESIKKEQELEKQHLLKDKLSKDREVSVQQISEMEMLIKQ